MYPILGRFGPFFLYSYHAVMALGLLTTLAFTAYYTRPQRPDWLKALLISLTAGLLGGRLTFVAANWPYYQSHPTEIPLLWHGGLTYHGTLLTTLLALWLWYTLPTLPRLLSLSPLEFPRVPRVPLSSLSFTPLAPALPLAHTFGWLACYLEGCAYGRQAPSGPFTADLPDSYGVFALRYQTQLLGLALSLLTFLLIAYLHRHHPTPSLFWLSLALLSLGRIPLTLLRADPVPLIASIRLDTHLDSTITLISFILFLFLSLSSGRGNHPS
jgi:phosphatidylglycerol:prolipoprotein diacylglycerol transferase